MPYDPANNTTVKKMMRLTNNISYDIDQPSISGKDQISYLDDETGVKQRKTVSLDQFGNINSKRSTHADHDILTYHAADQVGIAVFQKGKKIFAIKDAANRIDSLDQNYTEFRQYQIKNQKFAKSDFVPLVQTQTNRPITPVLPNEVSLFQSEFPDPPGTELSGLKPIEKDIVRQDSSSLVPTAPLIQNPVEEINAFHPAKTEVPEKFRFTRMVASRLKFKLDHTVTTLDNELLFGGLNSYAGEKRGYEYPPAGFLIKGQIKDLFEDYAIEGGVRIPTNFNGTEYF
jgi:hypothetical protein